MYTTTKNVNIVNAGHTIQATISFKTEPATHQQINVTSDDDTFTNLWKANHLDLLLNEEKIATLNNGEIDLNTLSREQKIFLHNLLLTLENIDENKAPFV
ncbi:MAG: hypothetical protein J0I41_03430 [Filimonas sp.]|nr:hypothetical protein [Filimonas sp.]